MLDRLRKRWRSLGKPRDGDSIDGCSVDMTDPRYWTSDEDREGYLVPSTHTDEARPSTRTDEAPAELARNEVAL